MGLLRKVKRGKLKERLMNQAKLESYGKKFDHQIDSLEIKIKRYVQMVEDGHKESNKEKVAQGILYTRTAEEHLRHLHKLKNTLEVAKMNVDSQVAYDKFVDALQDFTKTFQEEQMSKRKVKKTMKKYTKGANRIQSQVEMIEKKISKVDNATNKSFDKNVKQYKNNDVESFLKEHTYHD